jgi:hypothetical protein
VPLAVGTAVVELGGRAVQRFRQDASIGVIDGYDTTHDR